MEGENEKVIKGADAAGGEEIVPLFSVFRPKPRPAPARAEASPPRPAPAPQAKPAVPPLEARLAGLEKKLQEAAERENARGPEKQMLDYLKVKTAELEEKLRDSQKKALEFAYELKGREESRKESRREMEEFLGAVKQQQSAAETERLRAMELEKSRQRIEALEQRLIGISSSPPDAGLSGRVEELAGKIDAVSARLAVVAKAGIPPEETGKLRALLKNAEAFGRLAAELSSVSARLDAAAKAGLPPEETVLLRALFRKDIADALAPLAGDISAVSARLAIVAKAGLPPEETVLLRALFRKDIADALAPLAGKITAVSARLDIVAKAGLPPEEAAKLRALFKKEIAEALGPLIGEPGSGLPGADENPGPPKGGK